MNSIKVALNSMRRNVDMTLASIILVFLTVFMCGLVGLIASNTISASKNAVDNLTLYVWAQPETSPEQVQELMDQITNNISVDEIELQTKQQQLEEYANKMSPDNPQALLDLFGGDNNPLKDEIKVRLIDGSKLAEADSIIRGFNYVEDVSFGDYASTQKFIDAMKKVAIFAILLALIFLVISVFIIMNTIKLTITSRKLEIEIMRLVGATKWYVRMPFIWEGVIFGLIGGIIAVVLLLFGYHLFLQNIGGSYGTTASLFIRFNQIVFPLIVFILLLGVGIGASGSLISTSRFLNKE